MFGKVKMGSVPQEKLSVTSFMAFFQARDQAIAAKNESEELKAEIMEILKQVQEGNFKAQYTYWVEDGKYFRAGVRNGYAVRDEAITETGFAGEQGNALPGQDRKDWVCLDQIKSP